MTGICIAFEAETVELSLLVCQEIKENYFYSIWNFPEIRMKHEISLTVALSKIASALPRWRTHGVFGFQVAIEFKSNYKSSIQHWKNFWNDHSFSRMNLLWLIRNSLSHLILSCEILETISINWSELRYYCSSVISAKYCLLFQDKQQKMTLHLPSVFGSLETCEENYTDNQYACAFTWRYFCTESSEINWRT